MHSSLAIDQLIAELAQRYDGLVPTRPLREAGHCRLAIANRVQAKTLVPFGRSVHRLATTDPTALRRAMAASLVYPDSWISHRSALAAYGATLRTRSAPIPAEISSPSQCRPRGVQAHRHERPSDADLGRYCDLPISRPWRAIVESASVLSEDDLAVAMDSLVQAQLASLSFLNRFETSPSYYPTARSAR